MGTLKHLWTRAVPGNPDSDSCLWFKRPAYGTYPNGEARQEEFKWNYLTFNSLDWRGPPGGPTAYHVQMFADDMMTTIKNYQPQGDGNCRDPFTILVNLYPQYTEVIEEAAHLYVVACLPGVTGEPLW